MIFERAQKSDPLPNDGEGPLLIYYFYFDVCEAISLSHQPAQPQLGSQQLSAQPQEASQQLLAQPHDASQQLLLQHFLAARRAFSLARKPQRFGLQQQPQGSQQLSAQPQDGSQPQSLAQPQLGSQPHPSPQASAQPQDGSQQLSAHPHEASQQLAWQHFFAARRAFILASRPHRFGLQQQPQGSQQEVAQPQLGSQPQSLAQPQEGSQPQSVAHPQLGSQPPQPPNMPKNALAFGALLRAMATLKPSVDKRR